MGDAIECDKKKLALRHRFEFQAHVCSCQISTKQPRNFWIIGATLFKHILYFQDHQQIQRFIDQKNLVPSGW